MIFFATDGRDHKSRLALQPMLAQQAHCLQPLAPRRNTLKSNRL
jgi:hypothetical protein